MKNEDAPPLLADACEVCFDIKRVCDGTCREDLPTTTLLRYFYLTERAIRPTRKE